MHRHLRSCKFHLASLCALLMVTIGSTGASADIIFSGNGDLTINGVFEPNQNFMVVFTAFEPATDMLSDPSRGLFEGATTLTLEDPAFMLMGVTATNANVLRQDQNPQGLFLAEDSNPFNAGFGAVFNQGGVISDPNVLVSLTTTPEPASFPGAGLSLKLTDGSTVQFNQARNVTVRAAAVPEPAATAIIIAGMSLLAIRRRK